MPPRQWEPLVEDFSRVMKLVHLAVRRDATDIEALKGDLFRAKRQAYEDGLTIQAANVGCAGRKGIAPPEVMRAMNEEAQNEAAGIVNTYNYDLAVAIRHIRTEVPRANRFTYAKRLRAWEEGRDTWKSRQIALWNQMNWLDRAGKDFLAHNPQLTVKRARVVPRGPAVCEFCQEWVNKGWVSADEARQVEWPAHLNCPHRWEFSYPRQKVDCAELWVGVPIQRWWETEYREFRTLTKGGPGSGNWGHAGRPGMVGGSSTVRSETTKAPLQERLSKLKPKLAEAAQAVYDAWQQDEDDEYGGGGICDAVTMAMGDVIAESMDVELRDGGQPGDDHAWLIVIDQEAGEIRGVDIPAHVYEEGGGYTWTKKEGVTIRPEDVDVFDIGWSMEEVLEFLEPGEGWVQAEPMGYGVGYSEKTRNLPNRCVLFVRGGVENAKIHTETKGGPGSGNWGHAGRPGLVGGSAPAGRMASDVFFPTTLDDEDPEYRASALKWIREGIRYVGADDWMDVPDGVVGMVMELAERHPSRVLRCVDRIYVAKDMDEWVRMHKEEFGRDKDPYRTLGWAAGDQIHLRPLRRAMQTGHTAVFDHEIGHVAYYASRQKISWQLRFGEDPNFDRHTAYSKKNPSEAFAESYMSWVASGGKSTSTHYARTYEEVRKVVGAVPKT